jgi:hypothetical protein
MPRRELSGVFVIAVYQLVIEALNRCAQGSISYPTMLRPRSHGLIGVAEADLKYHPVPDRPHACLPACLPAAKVS